MKLRSLAYGMGSWLLIGGSLWLLELSTLPLVAWAIAAWFALALAVGVGVRLGAAGLTFAPNARPPTSPAESP